jgi:hypothetical protein
MTLVTTYINTALYKYAWEEAVTVYITSVITIVTLVLVVPYMQTKSNRTVYILIR